MLTFSTNPGVAEQQMTAIIFYLTAFGYIDGKFDFTEKTFVRIYIRQLVIARATTAMPDADPKTRDEVVEKFAGHFLEVFEQIDRNVKELFDEAVADGEDVERFVYGKLKLRSYEIFRSFEPANQHELLATIDELIYADGTLHPAEEKFRDELEELLTIETALTPADIEILQPPRVAIEGPAALRSRLEDHPFFASFEQHYSANPKRIRQQAAADLELMKRFTATLVAQRRAGAGKLAGKKTIGELAGQPPFLDGHVYVHPAQPGRVYELTVLGDLHGCYSCLKAALLQSRFIERAWAHQWDPARHPDVKLVFLGDYIDRGRFSFDGVLRAALQLFVAMPDHVILLRGNHEWLTWSGGYLASGVYPAEALASIVGYAPPEVLEAYRQLFEHMPTSLLCERTLLVHGGIPRADTFERYRDLASLNDPELRFQMMWSDPIQADRVALDQQVQNPRFMFGREQFRAFMERVGMTTMIRGHEQIDRGFDVFYDLGDRLLLTVFSAGGHDNADLPPASSYRAVTPMALTLQFGHGTPTATPWAIAYRSFNYEPHNGLYRPQPLLDFRYA